MDLESPSSASSKTWASRSHSCLMCCPFLFAISASHAASLSQEESHRKNGGPFGGGSRAKISTRNPYQGEGQLRQLEDQLQTLTDAAPVQDRIRLYFRLGIAELFLGRERRALGPSHRSQRDARGPTLGPLLRSSMRYTFA